MEFIKKIFQNIIVQICLIVLVSRACIFFFGIWGYQVFPEYNYTKTQGVISTEFLLPKDKGESIRDIFGKFDSGYYLKIVNSGYALTDNSDNAKSVWAFMPLYPAIINAVTFFSNDQDLIFTTGLIISNLLFLISCILIKYLLRLFDKEKYTLKTVLLLCFFPGSIYFSFFYTEALFLFLSVVAAIFIKKEKWLAATLIIGLLGITRKTGLFFIIPFLIEFFRHNNFKSISNIWKALGHILLQIFPFLVYTVYLGFITQDISSVYSIQSLWTKIPAFPFSGVYHMLIDFRFTTIFQVQLCFLAGFVLFKARKIMPKEYLIYCGLSIIAFLSMGEMASVIRYLAILFPIPIALSELIKKRIVFEMVLIVYAIMQTFLLMMFISGYSFAT